MLWGGEWNREPCIADEMILEEGLRFSLGVEKYIKTACNFLICMLSEETLLAGSRKIIQGEVQSYKCEIETRIVMHATRSPSVLPRLVM